nr:DNA polymerase Y family protein [Rhabdothermincola sediminis]
MPVRTLVVWCPDWPVIAAGLAPTAPAIVLHANRVLACSPAARRDGVRRGQRRREAQGRSPAVQVVERDDARDARRFEPVVQALERFTPRLEVSRPGTCAFAVRGPSRYFGGDESLVHQVHAAVRRQLEPGWDAYVRVGVADNPFAARWAARTAEPVTVVPPGESAAFLAPLPIAALERPELVDVLERLGLHTLGQFAALDAADVVARFGAEGLGAHRLARGLDELPPASTPPPPDLEVVHELDPPADRVDTAAFVAKTLADELHARLGALGLACTRVRIIAETGHGERLERCWRHEGALSAGGVADRVRWQLDGWLNGSAATRPTAGITRLVLVPDGVVAATGRQLGFWGGETAAADRVARAVARVQGLLGSGAASVPEWRGGRGPGERYGLAPAAGIDLAAPRSVVPPRAVSAPWPGRIPAPSPATVPADPIPAEVRDAAGHPVGVSARGLATAEPHEVRIGAGPWQPVEAWAGPWPADERWWDPETHRRRARWQIIAAGRAGLFAVEGGRWWVEALYD